MRLATKAKIYEGGPGVFMARIVGVSGNAITQADVTSLVVTVVNTKTDALISTTTLDKTLVVFDTLQTNDIRWSVDSDGFNLLFVLGGTNFPDGGIKYQVKLVVTPATGPAYPIVWTPITEDLAGE